MTRGEMISKLGETTKQCRSFLSGSCNIGRIEDMINEVRDAMIEEMEQSTAVEQEVEYRRDCETEDVQAKAS